MELLTIKRTCPRCFGDGVHERDNPGGQVVEDPCTKCGGSGYVNRDFVDATDLIEKIDDMADKVDDIMDKCDDIFEQVSE